MGGGYARRGVAAGIGCVGEERGLGPSALHFLGSTWRRKKSIGELQLRGGECTRRVARPGRWRETLRGGVHVRRWKGGSLWIRIEDEVIE